MFGVVRVLQAFLPLLERSPAPVVVNVSSGMGSLAITTDPERLESTHRRPRLPVVEGGAEHAHHPVREGVPGAAGQRRRPGLHVHGVQRAPRLEARRAGRRGHRPDGVDRRRTARPAPTSTRTGRSRGERLQRTTASPSASSIAASTSGVSSIPAAAAFACTCSGRDRADDRRRDVLLAQDPRERELRQREPGAVRDRPEALDGLQRVVLHEPADERVHLVAGGARVCGRRLAGPVLPRQHALGERREDHLRDPVAAADVEHALLGAR